MRVKRALLAAVLLAPLLLIGTWLLTCTLLAEIGGWSQLAAVYPFPGDFTGKTWDFQSGRLGVTRYGATLTVGANEEGLYLDVMPLFRTGHPPLFIPWSDITTSNTQEWNVSYTRFAFARAPGVTLRLPRGLAEELMRERPEDG